jgi:hypothetical protein
MNTRNIRSWSTYITALCAAVLIIGCTGNEAQNSSSAQTENTTYTQQVQKQKSKAQIAKEEREQKIAEFNALKAKLDATPLTLIKKDMHDRWASLFFDADGDTNTTELVAHKAITCPVAEAKVSDAKIGAVHTIATWGDTLSHEDEEFCEGHRTAFEYQIIHSDYIKQWKRTHEFLYEWVKLPHQYE